MDKTGKQLILYGGLLVISLYFFVAGLIKASSFLITITLGVLFSMILLPVETKLRSWKIPKGLAVLISDLVLLAFCGLFFIVLGIQIRNITDKWPQYEQKLEPKIEKVQNYVHDKTGISKDTQIEKLGKMFSQKSGKNFLPKLTGFTGNFLLFFVYVFFFIYYREKFKNSILKFFPEDKRKRASEVLHNFSVVSQKYLFGRFLLIIFLIIIYSIGLIIVGIRHAILVSILAAVLSLIPYIGNIIGVIIALSMTLLTQGTMTSIIGVLVVFAIAQFIESYLLEPYIVGNKVDLNPVMTMIGVIIGGLIWGLAGMFVAIPLMGIMKVIFDSVPVLNPLGYILDEKDTGSGKSWMTKIKDKLLSYGKKVFN